VTKTEQQQAQVALSDENAVQNAQQSLAEAENGLAREKNSEATDSTESTAAQVAQARRACSPRSSPLHPASRRWRARR